MTALVAGVDAPVVLVALAPGAVVLPQADAAAAFTARDTGGEYSRGTTFWVGAADAPNCALERLAQLRSSMSSFDAAIKDVETRKMAEAHARGESTADLTLPACLIAPVKRLCLYPLVLAAILEAQHVFQHHSECGGQAREITEAGLLGDSKRGLCLQAQAKQPLERIHALGSRS